MSSIITRKEAQALGLKYYFTGKPCPRGHAAAKRLVSCTYCPECHRLREATPERRAANAKSVTKHRNKYPDKRRDQLRAHWARKGGYAAAPLERDCPPRPADGLCDCCLSPRKLVLDHDHVTGAFRGWVCNGCNTGRGVIDDPDKLRTRADFLDCKLPWQ